MLRSLDAIKLCGDNLLEKGQVLIILDRPNTPEVLTRHSNTLTTFSITHSLNHILTS